MRHGETTHNAQSIEVGGEVDSPLTEKGKEQARQVAPIIDALKLGSICHSPLSRAKDTMELATCGHACKRFEVSLLKEGHVDVCYRLMDLGRTLKPCAIVRQFLDEITVGINEALMVESPTLIISHGCFFNGICYLLDIDRPEWFLDNCELVEFTPDAAGNFQARSLYIPR
ncbi:MAG: phosphoglycerate mutase GpmB [Chlamydiia bacterium]|nr:phosphoglycerate mutase GpmB [Chlamydiia bacterium]